MGISALLSTPLYGGAPPTPGVAPSTSTDDVPRLLPVALGGHAYVIDLTKYSRETIDLLPSAFISSADETGEKTLTPKGPWRRKQIDWRGGAGQTYLDDPGSSDGSRFLRSKGIDPWTPRQFSLLPDTVQKVTSANTNLRLLLAGPYFYWADGSNLKWSPNIQDPTPTVYTFPAGGSVVSIATDGTYVYVATHAALLQRVAIGATPGSLSAFTVTAQPDVVAYANGRLFGGINAANGRLVEIDGAGKVATDAGASANLLDYTHSGLWNITAISPAGNGIYAIVTSASGGASEVLFIGTSTTIVGALATPVLASSGFPAGEGIQALYFYAGTMVMGTSRGVRLCSIATDNGLTFGPLIAVTGGVRYMTGDGQFVWFNWSAYDGVSSGLGRLNLGKFVETQVPAHASDLMVTSQASVTGVVSYNDARYLAISGSGIWEQSTDKVASGELVAGWLTWSTIEPKVILSIDVRHDALDGTVDMNVDYDAEPSAGGSNVDAGLSDVTGSFGPTASLNAGERKAERAMAHLVLTRSSTDHTKGPVVHRWSIRAQPSPFRVDEIVLPIIMYSKVLAGKGEGTPIYYNTLTEYQFLKSLEAAGGVTTYIEGGASYVVFIDKVKPVPEKWAEDNSYFEGLILVRMLTTEATT